VHCNGYEIIHECLSMLHRSRCRLKVPDCRASIDSNLSWSNAFACTTALTGIAWIDQQYRARLVAQQEAAQQLVQDRIDADNERLRRLRVEYREAAADGGLSLQSLARKRRRTYVETEMLDRVRSIQMR